MASKNRLHAKKIQRTAGANFVLISKETMDKLGWVDIPEGLLVVAWVLSVLVSLVWAKRRVRL